MKTITTKTTKTNEKENDANTNSPLYNTILKTGLIIATVLCIIFGVITVYAEEPIVVGIGPASNPYLLQQVQENTPIPQVSFEDLLARQERERNERYDYLLSVLNSMDEEDYAKLNTVAYNEAIRAWVGANYTTDNHDRQAMILCTATVIETVFNRLGDPEFRSRTKISKLCVSGQFTTSPKRSIKPEFQEALALVKSNYENHTSILPLDFRWFSTDCKANRPRSFATSGKVTPEDTIWIGEYKADGTPKKHFGHWYRRVF